MTSPLVPGIRVKSAAGPYIHEQYIVSQDVLTDIIGNWN